MRTLPEIQAELNSLEAEIKPLADRRAACYQELLAVKSPFKVGDVITWGSRGLVGEVAAIGTWCCDEPMWQVQNILKDGSRGKLHNVRNYENPRLKTP